MPTPAKNVNSKSGGNSAIMNSMQRNEMSPSNKRVDLMCQSSRPESVGSENRETVSNSSLKELRQIQTSAQIPSGVMLGMSSAPTIHSTKCGNVEYIVIMLDPPPCECEQLNNKRKKCKNHKKGQGTKRSVDFHGGKSGKNNAIVVREDNIEQQGAVDEKQAEDSEKETRVLGSYTPDKICIAGPAGIPVLIDIRKTGSSLAEPRIEMVDGVVKGILVRGPNDCPQFIPESVIQKNTDGTPKNINYTPGKLLRDPNGATVFHANISETDASRRCQNMNTYQADARSQDRIGSFVNTPCEIEVNEKGMPEITLLEDINSMPKSKRAAVGVMAKVENRITFLQTRGHVIGCRENVVPLKRKDNTSTEEPITKGEKDNRNDLVTMSKTRTDGVKATVNGLEPENEGTRSQPVEASVLVKSILYGKLPANICKNITNTEVSEVANAGVHSSTNERTEMVKRDFMGEGIDGAGVGVDSDSGGARWKSVPGKIIVSGTTDAKSRVLENNNDSPAGRLVGADGGGTALKVNCSTGKETSEESTYKRNANMKNSAKGETSSASITGKNSCKSSGNTNIPRFDVGASGSLGGSASTRNDISCYAIGNAAYHISRNISSGASRGGHSYVTPGTSSKKGGIQKYEKPDHISKKDCSVYMLPPGFK